MVTRSSQVGSRRANSPVPRRTFLAGLGAASVVAVTAACKPVAPGTTVPGPTGPATPPTSTTAPTPKIPSDPFSRSAWTPLVGQSVALLGAAGSVNAVLDSVTDVGRVSGAEQAFALSFRAPAGSGVLDQVHTVQTASAGRRTITAMPTDRGVDHRWYQAVVFNPR